MDYRLKAVRPFLIHRLLVVGRQALLGAFQSVSVFVRPALLMRAGNKTGSELFLFYLFEKCLRPLREKLFFKEEHFRVGKALKMDLFTMNNNTCNISILQTCQHRDLFGVMFSSEGDNK